MIESGLVLKLTEISAIEDMIGAFYDIIFVYSRHVEAIIMMANCGDKAENEV